jgi:hypothetical protein
VAGYDVVIAALHQAGSAARSAGEQVGAVDLAGPISAVADALPGSRTAQAASSVAEVWSGQIKGWSSQVNGFGKDMSDSADFYSAHEEAAERDFSTGIFPSGLGLI